ncbi:MAG: glycosyltransferase [Deltaproteobacteria bacterium]|jgi:glycosyltransferase involved in cell wall biosynthesis|nr:glycosyltransferase [Deltaproteobacteria bacterium]
MRILHCNTHESSGGAAIAANRLHRGLLATGMESLLAVMAPAGETPQVALLGGRLSRRLLRPAAIYVEKKLPEALYSRPARQTYATFSLLPSLQHRRINAIPKDILHLHWVGERLLDPWALAGLQGPVVWTMHDAWPFTGGCHYPSAECGRHSERCGRCPELGGRWERDLSRLHWLLKRRAIARIRPVMIAPSRAFAASAAKSGLLQGRRVEHIPNGIDAEIFRPLDKAQARKLLGLPQNDGILLFGAVNAAGDHRKGFDLLLQALGMLRASGQQDFLPVVFGASGSDESLPYPARFLGRLHDNLTLALAYSAADIFVCPSRQDNLPNTVLESLACGTPVAAFSVGGIPDMIDNGQNGYLAKAEDAADLAAGIALLLRDADLRLRMGRLGREKIEKEFSLPVIVRRHIALYEELLERITFKTPHSEQRRNRCCRHP